MGYVWQLLIDIITQLYFNECWKDAHHVDWLWDNAALEGHFHIITWVTLWNMIMTPDKCYCTAAFKLILKGCTPPKLIMEQYILKPKGTLHYMNMGDRLNIIDDANAFLFYNLIRWVERNPLRRTLSIQRRAFYCKLWDTCLDDLDAHNQLENSHQENLGDEWLVKLLYDELRHITLRGGIVKLDRQRDQ